MTPFAGKTAIVTGGASGIGRALATALVGHGARVTIADIDGDAAQHTAGELTSGVTGNGSVDAHQLDTRNGDEFRALVTTVAARDGRLDYLFNNAGISLGGPTHELTAAHWDRIIDVNLRGVVNGLLAAYPLMVEQGHGHLVNTASGAGLAAPPFVTAYATTKHAVVGLSTGLRAEAALHGVRVSVLCPGSIDTPILDRGPEADLPPMPSAPVTAREYLTLVKQKPIPADELASKALRKVARNHSVIVVPAAAKSLWYLQRCSPRLMEYVTATIARKVQRDLVKPRT